METLGRWWHQETFEAIARQTGEMSARAADIGRYKNTIGGTVLGVMEYEKDVGGIVHESLELGQQGVSAALIPTLAGQLCRVVACRDKDSFIILWLCLCVVTLIQKTYLKLGYSDLF